MTISNLTVARSDDRVIEFRYEDDESPRYITVPRALAREIAAVLAPAGLLPARTATTPETDDVRAWAEAAFLNQPWYVEHSQSCDIRSVGDSCIGGCRVILS